jgi:hypothetical protein
VRERAWGSSFQQQFLEAWAASRDQVGHPSGFAGFPRIESPASTLVFTWQAAENQFIATKPRRSTKPQLMHSLPWFSFVPLCLGGELPFFSSFLGHKSMAVRATD